MIVLPKSYYCIVENPIVKDKEGYPMKDKYGYELFIDSEDNLLFCMVRERSDSLNNIALLSLFTQKSHCYNSQQN